MAGGFGTRLQSKIKDVPKPMADIKGKPFLAHLIDYLYKFDINEVILSVGYKYEVITEYFGTRYKDVDIRYVIEKEPIGTGGAIKGALKWTNEENVLVLNGDTFFNIDFKKLFEFHIAKDSILTLALKPMFNFDRFGAVILKDDRVVGFEEKSFKKFGYINAGVYVMNRRIAAYLSPYKDNFSFETDFLQKNVALLKSFAFISDGYFIDIGIPEDYLEAQKIGGNK